MAPSPSLIRTVTTYVDTTGSRLAGIQAFAHWASAEPCFATYCSLPKAVRACRDGAPDVQDALLGALMRVGNDPLAQLAAVAPLSRRLAATLGAWRRGGAPTADIPALEADLVSECWLAVATLAAGRTAGEPLPPRLALVLVDRARAAVRGPRRRELRARVRQVGLDEYRPELASEDRAPVASELAHQIGAAVRAGRLSTSAARTVFLTRVAGYSTSEAASSLGRSAAAVRSTVSRAERVLVATGGF